MSWIERFPVIRTLRFWAAFWTTVLFFTLFVAFFIAIWHVDRMMTFRSIEANLLFMFDEYHAEYLLGSEFEETGDFVPEDSLPLPVREAWAHAWPDAVAVACLRESPALYCLCLSWQGQAVKARLDAEGRALSVETLVPTNRIENLNVQFNDEYHGVGYSHVFNLLVSGDGRQILAHSRVHPDELPKLAALAGTVPHGVFRTVNIGETEYRVRCAPTFDGNLFVFGTRLDTERDERIAAIFMVSLVLVFLASVVLGTVLAGKCVSGIVRVSAAAQKIQSGHYSQRVAHGNEGSEIDGLIDAFNSMVAHTENVITELRTISDNIAHDLKTPITRMRGKAELSLYHDNPGEQSLAEDIAEECDGMLSMINTMLEITRTEYDIQRRTRGVVDLHAEAMRAEDLFSPLAGDSGVALTVTAEEPAVLLQADVLQMRRLLANLLDNAIKFTPRGGRVSLTVRRIAQQAEIIVSDTGCGIPAAELPHVFERFFRSDKSRNIPGNGLGLSLVHAIVHAHGGTIRLDSREGEGTTVTIRL